MERKCKYAKEIEETWISTITVYIHLQQCYFLHCCKTFFIICTNCVMLLCLCTIHSKKGIEATYKTVLKTNLEEK